MSKTIDQTIEELKQKLAQAEAIKRKEEQRIIWLIGQEILKEINKDKMLRVAIFKLLDESVKNERDREKITKIFSGMEENEDEKNNSSTPTTSNNNRM